MTVYVCADYLYGSKVGGINRYMHEVVTGLRARGAEVVMVHGKKTLPPDISDKYQPTRLVKGRLSQKARKAVAAVGFARFFAQDNICSDDVVWVPVPTTLFPRGRATTKFLTIHDLGPIVVPGCYKPLDRSRWRWYLEQNLVDTTDVIVPSHAVAKDFSELFSRHPAKLHVIPHGVGFDRRPSVHGARDRVTSIGPLSRKKDSLTLLQAIKNTLPIICQRGMSIKIIGSVLDLPAEGHRILEELETSPSFGRISRVSEEELVQDYARTRVLLVSSRYEGFGLPILEGLHSGASVVASNIPAFREVGGSNCTYYPPGDAIALGAALIGILGKSTDALLSPAPPWSISVDAHHSLFERGV